MCDGEAIDEYYFDKYESGSYIGCDNNFVALPYTGEPVTIEIELLVSEDGAYSFYESPILGGYMDVLMCLVYNNFFIMLTSAFLIIFGIMFLAIALGFRSDLPEMDMQIYSALMYIVLGVWFLAQFKLLDEFIYTHDHQTEIEYISLYLVVPLMYMVMGSMRGYLNDKVFIAFSTVGSVVAVLPIFLHFTGLVHINRMLTVYQADAAILFIFMVVMLVKDSRQKKLTPSQILQLTGQATLSLSFIFNVFFYYIEVAGISEQIMLSKKAVPMGRMCMVFATLVNYQIYISESYARKVEHESLAHLAYADGLTGIPNRSKYEKYLSDLAETGEDYCIISIDLNGLKTVNDKQGHLMGDKYLTEFGMVLDKCFSDKGFIARIGGDEFVAVLNDEYLNQGDYLIQSLNRELDALNIKDPSIHRSAASGIAYRHETDTPEWNAVYLLADERMYTNKSNMKKLNPPLSS